MPDQLDTLFQQAPKTGTMATPATPGGIKKSMEPLDRMFLEAPKASPRSSDPLDAAFQKAPKAKTSPYTGPEETTSPVSIAQHIELGLANNIEGQKNILKQMGFEPLQDPQGNLLIKDKDKVYPVHEKGLHLGNIVEWLGGQLDTAGTIAGSVAGTALSVPTGGIINPVTGGAIGAGAAEFARQKLANLFGAKQKTDLGEIGIQTAVGGIAAAVPGGKIAEAILPRSILEKIIGSDTIEAIEKSVADKFMTSGDKVAADTLHRKLIDSALSKSVAGRAAVNIPTGGIIGSAQSGAETAYQGGSASDVAGSALRGFGAGALYGGAFGEVTHQGIGIAERIAMPEPSLESKISTEFEGKTPTVDELRSFVEQSNNTSEEKARITSMLDSIKQPTESTSGYSKGPFVLPEGVTIANDVEKSLSDSGYKIMEMRKLVNKLIDEIGLKKVNGETVAPLEFADVEKLKAALDRELPKYKKLGEEGAKEKPVTEKAAKKTVETVPVVEPKLIEYKLPKNLSDAKPRYYYGKKGFQLKFESDIDKALYIIPQAAKSAADSKYMDWLKTIFPNKTVAELKTMGREVKSSIKSMAATSKENSLTIPKTNIPTAKPGLDVANVIAQATKKTGPLVTDQPLASEKPVVEEPAPPKYPDFYNPDTNTVDVGKLTSALYSKVRKDTVVSGRGMLGKVVQILDGTTSSVFDPFSGHGPITRFIGGFVRAWESVLGTLGKAGEDAAKPLNDITFERDSLTSRATLELRNLLKIEKRMSPIQINEAKKIAVGNRLPNPEFTNKGIETPEQVLERTADPIVKEWLNQAFKLTEEISSEMAHRPYKDTTGKVVFTAGKPSVFFPIFKAGEEVAPKVGETISGTGDSVKLQEEIDRRIANNETPEAARVNAKVFLEKQKGYAGPVSSGRAAEFHYPSVESMQQSNIITDTTEAYQKWIAKNSRIASIMKTMGKEGYAPFTSEKDALESDDSKTVLSFVNSYYNKLADRLHEAVNNNISSAKGKFSSKEALAFNNLIDKQLDVILRGANVNEWVQSLREIQGYKLSGSFIPHMFQTFNDMLAKDVPTVAKAWMNVIFNNPVYVNKINIAKNGFELADMSGASMHTVLESEYTPVKRKALNIITKPLEWVARVNRAVASTSGVKWADRHASIVNSDIATSMQKVNSAKELTKLLGREIDPFKKITLSRDDILRSAYNSAKMTQFGYDPMKMPWFVNTPAGQLAGQFKSYIYRQTGFILDQTVGEVRAGNNGRAMKNFLLLATVAPLTGEGIRAIQSLFYGKPSNQQQALINKRIDMFANLGTLGAYDGLLTKEERDVLDRWIEDVASVGTLGLIDLLLKSRTGADLVSNLLGPLVGTSAALTDLTINKILPDLSKGEFSKSLEATGQFMLGQTGGLGRTITHFGKQLIQ